MAAVAATVFLDEEAEYEGQPGPRREGEGPARQYEKQNEQQDETEEEVVTRKLQRIATMIRAGSREAHDPDWAAKMIQRLARGRVAKRHRLRTSTLHDRLKLESTLMEGLRVIILSLGLFVVLMMILRSQTNTAARFGLRGTYADVFELEQISEIATVPALNDFLKSLSTNVRKMQVLSSDYFVERQGELKILPGIETFDEPVQLEGYILQKPLGSTELERRLSCYGWFFGEKPRLDFGAHDYGGIGGGGFQESFEAEGEWWGDGELHLEVVVVNQTTIRFFQDATLRSEVAISRPVTDCSGKVLLVGGNGLRLGEVTYFARPLTTTEIAEIFFAGFTLEAIAAGKQPFAPAESDFDRLNSEQRLGFSAAATERAELLQSQQHFDVVTQAISSPVPPPPPPPKTEVRVQPEAGCDRTWPTCNVIKDVQSTLSTDSVTGHKYYDLIPPSLRNGAAAKARMYAPPGEYSHYDPATFPRWRNKSVSFTAWVKAEARAGTGYLLTKSPDFDEPLRCWTFHLELNGVANIGGAVHSDGWTSPTLWSLLPEDLDFDFGSAAALRHIAQVFDVERNSLRGYLDGELFAESFFEEPDAVAKMDCDVNERGYVGFVHRGPGSGLYVGDLQDMRMYVGTALKDEEVRKIAMEEGGAVERECKLLSEGSDSTFRDLNNNDCAWYQEARGSTPAICSAEEVRRECPVACEAHVPCFQPNHQGAADVHKIWERVMHLTPNGGQSAVVCVRTGLEAAVVQECRRLEEERDPRSYPPADNVPFASYTAYIARERSQQIRPDLNLTDCEALERTVSPYCSFSPAGDWTRGFDAKVQASGAMTMTMWLRVASPEALIDGQLAPNVMLLSSVAPPVPVLAFYVRTSGLVFATVWGGCGDSDREDALIAQGVATDRWVHVSIVWGSTAVGDGKRRMQIVVDSVFSDDLLWWDWCRQLSGETVQAVVVTPELLASPIELRADALTPKQIQQAYYQLRPAFRRLRGPSVTDEDLVTARIQYQQPPFASPGALVTPPILLQTRLTPSSCTSAQGNAFLSSLWTAAVEGASCAAPYLCSTALQAGPSSLFQCTEESSDSSLETHFGRPPLTLSGERVFSEFLPSIADATVLVRDGQQFETASFIDTTTSKVTVLLVVFSVQYSIVTTVSITAEIGATVSATYDLLHLSSVEGAQLQHVTVLVVVACLLICFNLGEIIWDTLQHKRQNRERRRLRKQRLEASAAARQLLSAGSSRKLVARSVSSQELDALATDRTLSGRIGACLGISAAGGRPMSKATQREKKAQAMQTARRVRRLALDLLSLVLIPLAFLALRLWQAHTSGQTLVDTVGTGGLGAVPWAAKDVALEAKMERFFSALEDLQIRGEQRVNVAAFAVGLLLLLRCILATKVHPRIAVLVNTLASAFDDLWHFLLLFVLMFCGFAILATVSFGGDWEEFATLSSSFETMFSMMMGEVQIEGVGRSNLVNWTWDPLMVIFVVLFNFLIFFVMLNFIIAIIVEAYLNAKQVVEKDETEQEFFTDCLSAIRTFAKGRFSGWPPHWRLVLAMDECVRHTVGIDNLTVYFPDCERRALLSFLRHYEGYDFILPVEASAPGAPAEKKQKGSRDDKELTQRDLVEEVVRQVELRTATLLNVPVPSAGDRALRQDALVHRPRRQRELSRAASQERSPVRSPIAQVAPQYGSGRQPSEASVVPQPTRFLPNDTATRAMAAAAAAPGHDAIYEPTREERVEFARNDLDGFLID